MRDFEPLGEHVITARRIPWQSSPSRTKHVRGERRKPARDLPHVEIVDLHNAQAARRAPCRSPLHQARAASTRAARARTRAARPRSSRSVDTDQNTHDRIGIDQARRHDHNAGDDDPRPSRARRRRDGCRPHGDSCPPPLRRKTAAAPIALTSRPTLATAISDRRHGRRIREATRRPDEHDERDHDQRDGVEQGCEDLCTLEPKLRFGVAGRRASMTAPAATASATTSERL